MEIEGDEGMRALRPSNLASKRERPKKELIHHSDRGIQYFSHAYVKVLKQSTFFKITQFSKLIY